MLQHHLEAVSRPAPSRTSPAWRHQRAPTAKRTPRALAANGAGGAVRAGTPHLEPSAVTLTSQPTQPPLANASEHLPQSTYAGMAESPVAPAVHTTRCLIIHHLTTTLISIYMTMIPRGTATTAWKMCARAVMVLTMLALFRVADTTTIIITITMITRCHRSRRSFVPNPVPLEAAAVRHPLNNSSSSHPDRRLPLAGLSVPANPTEARVPVKTAQVEAACSPGPRGRAKNLHQYDRRFRYFRSSLPCSFCLLLLCLLSSSFYFSTITT
jgi:hypothetical protein